MEEKMCSDFARNLTLLRKERKISQKQAAADLGVSQALLSHYEKGVRECGLKFLVKAADYYNVSCDSLLGRGCAAEEEPSDEEEAAEFRRRTLGTSINILMRASQECGSNVEKKVASFMILSVYKMMRVIGITGKSKKSDIEAKAHASAALSMSEAEITTLMGSSSAAADNSKFSESFANQCEKMISDITGFHGE